MKENQQFNTIDSVSVLALVTGVVVLIGTIVSNAMTDRKEDRAKIRSEQLAMQILVGGYKSLSDSKEITSERDLASAEKLDLRPDGRIGMDPWGRPYHYSMTLSEDARLKVFVYSYGPNGEKETMEGFRVAGDDIGSIVFDK